MELQRQFSQDYLTEIKNKIYDADFRKKYVESTFVIEDIENNVVKIPGLYNNHVNLKMSSKPSDDFENAKAFYEAYKDMSPIIASQETIWAYLTHVEYFDYVKERWSVSIDTSADTMIDHFFVRSMLKIARNGLARLWWPVYITYDKKNEDPYHLTKIFFANTQIVVSLSESVLFTCKPLTQGVLEFFEEHPDVKTSKANIEKIMEYFNALGGVRNLAFDSKEFIKHTIETEIEL